MIGFRPFLDLERIASIASIASVAELLPSFLGMKGAGDGGDIVFATTFFYRQQILS